MIRMKDEDVYGQVERITRVKQAEAFQTQQAVQKLRNERKKDRRNKIIIDTAIVGIMLVALTTLINVLIQPKDIELSMVMTYLITILQGEVVGVITLRVYQLGKEEDKE